MFSRRFCESAKVAAILAPIEKTRAISRLLRLQNAVCVCDLVIYGRLLRMRYREPESNEREREPEREGGWVG